MTALCTYCDDNPITLDADGEGGPYCDECLERFYGPRPLCDRCGDPADDLAYATPGDWNAPEWCGACRAAHATHAAAVDGYCDECGK